MGEDVEMMSILAQHNAQASGKPVPQQSGSTMAKHAFAQQFDCNDDGHLDGGEMQKAANAWVLAQHKAQQSYYDLMDYGGYTGYYGDYYDGDYDDDYYGDYYYDDAGDYYYDDAYLRPESLFSAEKNKQPPNV